MHGRRRLFKQAASPGHVSALAHQPHGGPERCLRAGDDRKAAALFERFGDTKRAQTAAGDQDAFGVLRSRHRFLGKRDNIGLALTARLAEAQKIEALERQHFASG